MIRPSLSTPLRVLATRRLGPSQVIFRRLFSQQPAPRTRALPLALAFGASSLLFWQTVFAEEPAAVPVEVEEIVVTENDEPVAVIDEIFTLPVDPAATPVPHLSDADLEAALDVAIADAAAEVAQESAQQPPPEGAFNPETGEINWDCPCLGGMAHGPCGPEFKAAFSCFVFSESEPKGVNCIPLFETMQNCFRKYPETYAEDLRYIDDQQKEAEAAAESAESAAPAGVAAA